MTKTSPAFRARAKAAGVPRYSTGKPCSNGHNSERHTSTGKCTECTRLHRNRQYKNNAEHHRNRQSRFRSENRERLNTKTRNIRKENPDRAKKSQEKWLKKHPGWKSDNWARYYRENIDRERARGIAKAASRRAAEGSFTADDVSDIRRMQKDKCAMPNCRVFLDGRGHVDHIIPVSKNGSSFRRNIQLLCARCNLSKKNRDPVDHIRSLGFLI